MAYNDLMFLHLFTVIPCFIIGTVYYLSKKGTVFHKQMGRIYLVLMLFTATVTLFMPAAIGATFLDHFGWIHLFSALTIYTLPTAYLSIKKGNVKVHKRKMILLYFGTLIIAGGFTLAPGRYLHELLF